LSLGVVGAGAATLAYASLIERVHWTLRRYDVPVLAQDAEPLRILQVSDLHMLPGQRSKQEWVRSLDALDPDFVALTGDNLSSPDAIPAVLDALGPLLRRPGAFVFGSNDYYGPVPKNPFKYFNKHHKRTHGTSLPWTDLRDALKDSGWVDLTNARGEVTAGGRRIELAGVDDPHLWIPALIFTWVWCTRPSPECSTSSPPTASICCSPATPTAANSGCPATALS
jgi:predicted MPP superfamily phosphohydrolase